MHITQWHTILLIRDDVVVRCAEELQKEKEKYKVVNNELDATFAELTGF